MAVNRIRLDVGQTFTGTVRGFDGHDRYVSSAGKAANGKKDALIGVRKFLENLDIRSGAVVCIGRNKNGYTVDSIDDSRMIAADAKPTRRGSYVNKDRADWHPGRKDRAFVAKRKTKVVEAEPAVELAIADATELAD
jgi:hypothetical protein